MFEKKRLIKAAALSVVLATAAIALAPSVAAAYPYRHWHHVVHHYHHRVWHHRMWHHHYR